MLDYKKLYFRLFGELSDIAELLERGDGHGAKDALIRVLQEAEARYLEEGESLPERELGH